MSSRQAKPRPVSPLTGRLLETWSLALRWAAARPGLLAGYGLPEPDAAWRQLVLEGRASAIGGPRVFDQPLEALLGVLPVACTGGFWEPAEDGTPAVIQPVTLAGRPGPAAILGLVDLVAWRPAQPDLWWLLVGSAQWLGPAEREPLSEDGPMRLVSTPLAWLGAQDSVCVLDWSADTVARLLPWGDGEVVCDDVEIGERVQRLLGRARIPQIGVELREAA